ncbi:MAG TPA: ATP12 family protein [Paracoccaceae bacterium]|nr:ATP12 family protein [Paracoccaceae bacterium]HMO72520.1 ATP12 family protein [Paracoccaceae bacterium]
MAGWATKRFWSEARAAAVPGGWGVALDGRSLRTPAKAVMALPTAALARAVAAEWQAVDGRVQPGRMPLTRLANSAQDKVAPQFAAVAAAVAAYGDTDLLCYRAAAPVELAARQAAGWDPILDWAATACAAPLAVTQGLMPCAQPAASLAALAAQVAALGPHELAALHDLVAIPGSLVLGLAVSEGRLTADAAFDLSRIDEAWQAEQWGLDAEAAESEARKRADHAHAARFFGLCRSQD